ncbi:MAG TPA: S41 family peptidase [Phycisphaerae bacterium]|nr:S41 family peptidase [Phycisphaerae bacterium]HNU44167.1 S41 family peptidase [Phycisphaerae bacterium]
MPRACPILQDPTLWTVLLTLGLASFAAGAAPKVIQATPDNGDTHVNPALTEIRVVFDQDMTQGSHSWVGDGPSFPKLRGQPSWLDARTAVLPVTLEPNHTYWLSINSDRFRGFQATNGTPAEPYPISFTTASAPGAARPPDLAPEQNSAAIKKLRAAIKDHYSYRDLRQLDWDQLFQQHERGLAEAKTPAAFAREAGKLLATAQDAHIWLSADGQKLPSFVRRVEANLRIETLARVVPGFKQQSPAVYTGRFDDGIGYVLITAWSGEQRATVNPVWQALEQFAGAPGIILDVRPNSGGDELLARQVAGCFVEKPVVYARHVWRDPAAPTGFSPQVQRVLEPNAQGPVYRGKVAVLTGPAVMSSCESFLLMMKQAPDCKLVGARSYGSSGNPKPHDLGNGVTVYLPSWKDLRPDGTCLEGEGIAPDVPVPAQAADFADRDPVLDTALALLRQRT